MTKETGNEFTGVDRSLESAVSYLEKRQAPKGSFRYRLADVDGRQSLTAAAIFSLEMCGKTQSEIYQKGMKYLSEKIGKGMPLGSTFYTPYFNATVAHFPAAPEVFVVGGVISGRVTRMILEPPPSSDVGWLNPVGIRSSSARLICFFVVLMRSGALSVPSRHSGPFCR